MIERRVLKEKEKREREKWGGGQDGRRSMEGKGGSRRGRGAEEELNPAFTLKKKVTFFKVKSKKEERKKLKPHMGLSGHWSYCS